MGVSRVTTQSPQSYSNQNLSGSQLAARMASTAAAAQRLNLRTAIQDQSTAFQIQTGETAAGLVDANLVFGFVDGDVRRYGAKVDGATDDSLAFYRAMISRPAAGGTVLIPGGNMVASIGIYRNNISIVGAGRDKTTITMPTAEVAVTSVVVAAAVATVTCSANHNVWVGKPIRIRGTTNANHNTGWIVTGITSNTVFTANSLSNAIPNSSSTGGFLGASSVMEAGELCYGNSATARTGLYLQGFTLDGKRGTVATPDTDLTNWGLAFTAFSKYSVIDVAGIHCWNGGVGTFINSNYGYMNVYVEDCSFSAFVPPGFDCNSSKYCVFDVVSNACNYGARVLDNCNGIIGRFTINNATVTGFIYGNQTVNESHSNDFTVTVDGGCTSSGIQIGNNCRNTRLRASINSVTGNGINEVYFATASQRPAGNSYDIKTRNCGAQGAIIGGDGGSWNIVSYLDGRTGAAGSSFAIEIDGTQNVVNANITDSAVAQVRGITATATSASNTIVSFNHNTLVSNFSDAGASNSWPFETDTWHAAAFNTNWVNSSGAPAAATQYKKVGNTVSVIFNFKANAGATGTVFVLPAGYRPTVGTLSFSVDDNLTSTYITIDTSGNVAMRGGATAADVHGYANFSTT